MRLPHCRLKFRALVLTMAAGAVLLGVGIAAVRLKSRSSCYGLRAVDYAFKEQIFAKQIELSTKMAEESKRIDQEYTDETRMTSGVVRVLMISQGAIFRTQAIRLNRDIARYQTKSEWYAMMKNRYRFACTHPWLSVPADPPEPK